jgi:hypothetical protein
MTTKKQYWDKKAKKFQHTVEKQEWQVREPASEATIVRVIECWQKSGPWDQNRRTFKAGRDDFKFLAEKHGHRGAAPIRYTERRWRVCWREAGEPNMRYVEWQHIEMARGLRDGLNFLFARRTMAMGTKAMEYV